MKISALESLLLGLTAAFLLLCTGYLLGSRSAAQPYRVEVQRHEVDAPANVPVAAPTPTGAVQRVNLNTATADELQALPGIGERRAEDIVADRTENGPFRHVEDLTRVKGIGEGTLAGLMDFIYVDE